MKIKVLDDSVVNKIAAGEVVERPASVVRELFDNAIDAGATEVKIEIEAGGEQLISLTDNGSGMSRDDALLAFERHATSKISDENDLESLATLGFRGEALPSIAAVSKVRLRTRSSNDLTALEVIFHGGQNRGVKAVPGPLGTQIEIRNLFFNTPARKKFLKSEQTETQKIKSWILNASLAHPQVRISLYIDGKESFVLPQAKDFEGRARQHVKGASVSFYHEDGPIQVEGLIAHPSMAQSDAGALVLLVNRRVVNDRVIFRAVKEGFDSMLKDREVPIGALSILLPGTEVDVNVHPQKSEVRFKSHQVIFAAVRDAVRDAVAEFKGPAQFIAESAKPSQDSQKQDRFAFNSFASPRTSSILLRESSDNAYTAQFPVASPRPISPDNFRFSDLKYVGQVLKCFLICEYQEMMYAVDMHAAHERTTFAEVRKRFENKTSQSQELLVPITVALLSGAAARVCYRAEILRQFGIVVEEFGDDAVIVRATPPFLKEEALQGLIKDIAAMPIDDDAAGPLKELVDHMATRIACHASIRSGESLTREEVYALFRLLDEVEISGACPHGRPVIAAFSRDDIDKWFGRDR